MYIRRDAKTGGPLALAPKTGWTPSPSTGSSPTSETATQRRPDHRGGDVRPGVRTRLEHVEAHVLGEQCAGIYIILTPPRHAERYQCEPADPQPGFPPQPQEGGGERVTA